MPLQDITLLTYPAIRDAKIQFSLIRASLQFFSVNVDDITIKNLAKTIIEKSIINHPCIV